MDFTVSITHDKIKEIINTCNLWPHKTHCSKKNCNPYLKNYIFLSVLNRPGSF